MSRGTPESCSALNSTIEWELQVARRLSLCLWRWRWDLKNSIYALGHSPLLRMELQSLGVGMGINPPFRLDFLRRTRLRELMLGYWNKLFFTSGPLALTRAVAAGVKGALSCQPPQLPCSPLLIALSEEKPRGTLGLLPIIQDVFGIHFQSPQWHYRYRLLWQRHVDVSAYG